MSTILTRLVLMLVASPVFPVEFQQDTTQPRDMSVTLNETVTSGNTHLPGFCADHSERVTWDQSAIDIGRADIFMGCIPVGLRLRL